MRIPKWLLLTFLFTLHVTRGVAFSQDPATEPADPVAPVIQNPQSATDDMTTQDVLHSVLKPQLRQDSVPAAGQPVPLNSIRLSAEPEKPPRAVRAVQIRPKKQLSIPYNGAGFLARSDLVPEPFCETHPAVRIGESTETSQPRRCHDANSADHTLSRSSSETIGADGNQGDLDAPEKSKSLTAVFAGPAHFAMGNCESGGASCSAQPPMMIYEGMSVLVNKGCYEVRGIVEGPLTPAILRLQLTFFTTEGVELTTVTLPPVRLEPELSSATHLPSETQAWLIRRKGYSDVLRDWETLNQPELTVQRSGIVQMGHVPKS